MGRKKRNLEQPCCYHITHRCQERRFLLRYQIDRRRYSERLRQMVQRYPVDVLDYIITSNHVHLLLFSQHAREVSAALHFLQGNTARDYNRRVGREGAFWRGRYHPTLIENGPHLGRCVFYIDLNMVRAGVVSHPQQWQASGYHELNGTRRRYRLINVRQLIRCLGIDPEMPESMEHFREWYRSTLAEKLTAAKHVREAYWSEAAAIGSEAFVRQFAGRSLGGRIEAISVGSTHDAGTTYALTLPRRDEKAVWNYKLG